MKLHRFQRRQTLPCPTLKARVTLHCQKFFSRQNCSFFNLDETHKEAEMGIMIGDKDYWNQGYGTDAVRTALHFIFTNTELDSIRLKTLDWNIRAHKCFLKCGFAVQGNLIVDQYCFILMRINRTDYINQIQS